MANVTRGSGLLEGFLAKKRAQLANNKLKNTPKNRILDIGCGTSPYFLTTTSFKEKYGVDPSVNLQIEGMTLRKLNVSNNQLPFKDNFFDAVTMLAVFEHIDLEKLDFVLREVRRVLREKGEFVITTPAPWSDMLLHNMAKVGLISAEEIHEHKSHYNMKTIVDIIKKSGFEKQNIKSGYFELGFNMWFVIKK